MLARLALPLWIHAFEPVSAAVYAKVAAALEQAGLELEAGGALAAGFGLVLIDGIDGTVLERVRTLAASAKVLAIAVGARPPATADMWALLECGAFDVLSWTDASGDAAQVRARLERRDALQRLADSPAVCNCLVGVSPAWRALVHSVVEVAAFTESPVLITGETGTGKDQIAQLIHRLGGRGELTVLDCTTLTPELAGSELFGHERGAFTGAANARDGAFALADGGVLFLDEVGELPLPLQAQLLRVLQEHAYKRVGSNTWQHSHFRLVCATNRSLEDDVANGRFRADLYHRIAAWRCRTPPLRERSDDVLPLARHFLALLAGPGVACEFDDAVREFLLLRQYPGNVRELRQTVARLWYRHSGPGPITIGDLAPDERPARGATQACWPDVRFESAIREAIDLRIGLARISQAAADIAIQLVLEQEGDNNQRAALRLGVTDRALQIRRKAWAEAH
ncbi:sigma 54-interacting transcriptional regulator [Massilia sp. P8910]|uniref:sigma-54-dependent transcriptional regulator n=1 Tax=Massilia antarctica TaxID=2765360 RepID=UPI0006BB7CF6|nr:MULTISPECIES: sigma 54-interacting transcriptional regulator [Massilia]MCE3604507.1 sigma 54-interacting transcriptional regulator [Massilia antarctica]MCY0913849.1 sigma 54-interacting transcriptional regulator [Massilia sp. H27-R4]